MTVFSASQPGIHRARLIIPLKNTCQVRGWKRGISDMSERATREVNRGLAELVQQRNREKAVGVRGGKMPKNQF